MECPHCHQQVPDGPECASCGIVIAKFMARRVAGDRSGPPAGPAVPQAGAAAASPPPAASPPAAAPMAPVVAPPLVGGGPGLRKLSERRQINLYQQLGRMLEAGLGVGEALRLAAQNSRGALSEALSRLHRDVDGGQTLAAAAAGQPGLFPEHSRVLLEAGEVTGGLPAAFSALASAAELRLDLRRQIVRACIYPFVLFTMVFFVPKAYLLFTVGLIGYLIACLPAYLLTLVVLFCLVWLLPWALKQTLGPQVVGGFVRRLPLARGLFKLAAEVRFARHLAGALDAGLAMGAAITLAARSTGDAAWAADLDQVEAALQRGDTLHRALAATGRFDEEFKLALAAGERSGTLVEALEQHARLLQTSLHHRLNVTVQLLSVTILVLTYVFVAQTVVSEFETVMGGARDQMDQVLKELGGDPNAGLETLLKEAGKPSGYSKLPQELKDLLK